MTLLEREEHLERLTHLLGEASADGGKLAVVSGEAGVGKTSLVRGFLAAHGDVHTLRSFCEDMSVPDPLGPLYDLAREARRPLERDSDRPLLSLFSDVLEMLEGAGDPTIVIIEDLHWADDATLDFVRFLGRRVDGTHLLVILTARTEGQAGQKRLRRALVDVPPQNLVRIEVPPFSRDAVAALATGSGMNSEAVYRATGGNPFFVTELLGAGGDHSTPIGIREAVLERADRLDDDARAAVNLVAMFPRRAETEVLSPLLQTSAGLERAISSGLLEQTADGIAFRHEIVRRAIEFAVPETVRRSLNGSILELLRHVPDVPIARLAHHAKAARDKAAVLELVPAAGAWAASVGAHHEAASHYKAALDTAPDNATLAHALALECSLTGRLHEAIAAEQSALASYRLQADRIREGDSLRWLSRFSYLAGRRDDTDRYGDMAIVALEAEEPGVELAMAYANHAQIDMLAERVEPTLRWGHKAMELAEQLRRDDIICATLNNIGHAWRWTRPEEARRNLARSLEMAVANNWHDHAARAYTNLGCMDVELMMFDAAEEHLQAGIAYCAERDLDTLRLYMTGWLAQLRLRQGRWSDASDIARRVLDSDRATALARYQAADVVARLRIRRGDPGAEEPITELEAVLVHGREFQRLAPYATLMAERAWIQGADPAAALHLINEASVLVPQGLATKDLDLWRSILAGEDGDWAGIARARASAGMPFEAAMALLMHRDKAATDALLIFRQLGASAVTARAGDLLANRGLRGPRRTTLANEAGLTMRELEVLRLVGEGMSNKSIARKLDVSPKTVDHHVSSMLEKLGAESRGQAAALARQRGMI